MYGGELRQRGNCRVLGWLWNRALVLGYSAKRMKTDNQLWLAPPSNMVLAKDEIHVWRTILDLPSSQVDYLWGLLTADERSRGDNFHFAKDRRHFIVARGVLRTILGFYLGVAPEQLRFDYNRHGKPSLTSEFSNHTLSFNLSHAGGLALYAIVGIREVGIDVERIRTNFDYEDIAERFFSPTEIAVLRTIPADTKAKAFFDCWTRKEAYIKAQGDGLSLPLHSFDVSFAPDEPARFLAIRNNEQQASDWTLHELTPGSGYVGALAVKGCDWQYRYWQWSKK